MYPKIYLDHNATTIIDPEVVEGMIDFIKTPNNSSSIHFFGRRAKEVLELSRNKIAKALNIDLKKDNYNIVFTSSGTEANNLVINSFEKDLILASSIEHDSILKVLPKNNYALIPVDANGIVKIDEFKKLLEENNGKKIVTIMMANNETGVIQDISELVKISHENGAIFHSDATQAFGKIPIDLKSLNLDLMTISSHKSGGPAGASALIYKKNLHLKAQILGGGQENGLRSGTENILSIVGFGEIANNIEAKIEQYKNQEKLRNDLEKNILKVSKDAEFYSQNVKRLPNTSCIKMKNVDSLLQLIKFDLNNIAISAGSACSSGKIESSHVLLAMGVSKMDANCTIRMSLGANTKSEEIQKFLHVWEEIYNDNKNQGIKNA